MASGKQDLRASAAALCRHEAGHHVVARMCGLRVGSISLKVELFGGRSGHAEVILAGAVESLGEVEAYLERRVKILYAGAAAEALQGSKVDADHAIKILHGAGGENDWARARDCIQLLRNLKFSETSEMDVIKRQLSGLDQELWSDTVALVEKSADVIGRLVEMMARKVTPSEPITILAEEIESVEGVKDLGPAPES